MRRQPDRERTQNPAARTRYPAASERSHLSGTGYPPIARPVVIGPRACHRTPRGGHTSRRSANVTWTIESSREAAVPADAVFALYADPDTWSRWGHNATWAQADGPLEVGGIVRVRAGYGTVYRCLVRRFEPGRALELVVKPAGLTIINVYEAEPTAGGCRVRHALEVSGPLSSLTRPFLSGMYRRKLDAEVEAVIRLGAVPDAATRADPVDQQVSAPERAWHGVGRALRGGREEQRD
jgi:hypothetical protein